LQQIPFGFLKTSAAPFVCTGYVYGGYCFYLAGNDEDCDALCASEGGVCDPDGLEYSGSSVARCENILNNLGSPGAVVELGFEGSVFCGYFFGAGGPFNYKYSGGGSGADNCPYSTWGMQVACSCK
tara:strand:- start:549 stop:926 length:378 start_codon:yes stop_codon:yes gene_type:complete